jgi:aminopeptidase N
MIKFVVQCCAPLFTRLGGLDQARQMQGKEPAKRSALRSALSSLLSQTGSREVGQQAAKALAAYVESPASNPLPADLRARIFHLAAKAGGAAAWRQLVAVLKRSDNPEEQRNCLSSLGLVDRPEETRATLEMAFDESRVRPQDLAFLLASVCSTELGSRLAWTKLTEQWTWFTERYSKSNFVWANIVGAIAGGLRGPDAATTITTFFAEPAHNLGSAQRRVSQVLEGISARQLRHERNVAALLPWLTERGLLA